MLHKQTNLSDLSFINFIYSYANLIDCLMKKFDDLLKKSDEGT
jgi:hypothetical protein